MRTIEGYPDGPRMVHRYSKSEYGFEYDLECGYMITKVGFDTTTHVGLRMTASAGLDAITNVGLNISSNVDVNMIMDVGRNLITNLGPFFANALLFWNAFS